ncbi:hypothetical protein NEISICOT_03301 [Neisseria sicca ATCC 29256]|uniref:Uncharacterized protein n=1 Tax=Neisseria sicca ATCC 29256 TaxID=547045 RepID=C6M9S3_NEISI|nr:hypothetical protein NEISICOT_03301 [Neisseria sicca ATCC 29256]
MFISNFPDVCFIKNHGIFRRRSRSSENAVILSLLYLKCYFATLPDCYRQKYRIGILRH